MIKTEQFDYTGGGYESPRLAVRKLTEEMHAFITKNNIADDDVVSVSHSVNTIKARAYNEYEADTATLLLIYKSNK